MNELIARARGLSSRLVGDGPLGEIEAARDPRTLGDALARAGLPAEAAPRAIESFARRRYAEDLATLVRWSRESPGAIRIIELDEDRHTLRDVARGLAAGVGADQRLAGAIPTRYLPPSVLAELAAAERIADVAKLLAQHDHPLAFSAPGVFDLFEIEQALTRSLAACARPHEHALVTYIAQLVDCENVVAALLLASRGRDLDRERLFVDGGRLLDRATFLAGDRDAIARAFARTPIATAVNASSPAALEDAALAWQIATQAQLRRREPHGLSTVLHLVLRARSEMRRLRRVAWSLALGGLS